MNKRKPKPWPERPITRGKGFVMMQEPLPIDPVAPPKSTAQYRLAKARLLDDLYGDSIVECRHCHWPMLKGYQCRTCNGEQ